MEDHSQLQKLLEEREKINNQIADLLQKNNKFYSGMSAEVKDDNPYSRLMALKRMGIVENYEEIRLHSIIIVGMGGVGSVVGEMLTRCGIGKLILFDYDKVELANMNRLFYTPQQVGLSKVEAAKQTLIAINPELKIEAYNANVTTGTGYDQLKQKIEEKVSLVLSCVDNYAARMTINSLCCELDQVWFESGVSENAMSAHIQLIVPGETACFSCAVPLAVEEDNEQNIKREGVCAASLPTTMGLTAGFMTQNVLKYLLRFGEVSFCLSYNALKDFFYQQSLQPNPDCKLKKCIEAQKRKAVTGNIILKKLEEQKTAQQKVESSVIVHAVNEWNIEIVKEEKVETQEKDVEISTEEVKTSNLDDLMAKLKNM